MEYSNVSYADDVWRVERRLRVRLFGIGTVWGFLIGCVVSLVLLVVTLSLSETKPTAIDVYRNKTELKVTSVNGTAVDSLVVFKKEYKK